MWSEYIFIIMENSTYIWDEINEAFKAVDLDSGSRRNHLWDGGTYWWVAVLQPSSTGFCPLSVPLREEPERGNRKRFQWKTRVSLPRGERGHGRQGMAKKRPWEGPADLSPKASQSPGPHPSLYKILGIASHLELKKGI